MRYDEIRFYELKSGRCPECGKIARRQKKFFQTFSPYNKNEYGNVKTREKIWVEIMREGRAWHPDFTHKKCRREE